LPVIDKAMGSVDGCCVPPRRPGNRPLRRPCRANIPFLQVNLIWVRSAENGSGPEALPILHISFNYTSLSPVLPEKLLNLSICYQLPIAAVLPICSVGVFNCLSLDPRFVS
jgi:hypothetical protein